MSNTKKIAIEIEVPNTLEDMVHYTSNRRFKYIYDKEKNELYIQFDISDLIPNVEHYREMLGYCYEKGDECMVDSFAKELEDINELQDILRVGGICNG